MKIKKILKSIFKPLFIWVNDEFNEILDYWRYETKDYQWIRMLLMILHPIIIFGGFILKIVWKILTESYITFKLTVAWVLLMILFPWSLGQYVIFVIRGDDKKDGS